MERAAANGDPTPAFLLVSSAFLTRRGRFPRFDCDWSSDVCSSDLDKIVRKSRLSTKNWQDIAFIINDYQLANFVYPAFMLLRKYYQTSIPKFFLASIKPGFTNLINLIDFKNLSVFDDESRIRAGVNRFKLIFMLSPQPFWKRLMIFFNPQVVYFGSKVLRSKIISSRR